MLTTFAATCGRTDRQIDKQNDSTRILFVIRIRSPKTMQIELCKSNEII